MRDNALYVFGVLAGLVFYTRFYIQWIASERARRSIVPTVFWYQSSVGSVMLFIYSVFAQSPLGTLSHAFNITIYGRNLVHIWRERGTLNNKRRVLAYGTILVMGVVATALLANTWHHEYTLQQESAPDAARKAWFWLAVGVAGQGLFATRFLVQLYVSEKAKKSIVPPIFWHISLAAGLLMSISFFQRDFDEWVFAIGNTLTLFVYARNLWLIYRRPDEAPPPIGG